MGRMNTVLLYGLTILPVKGLGLHYNAFFGPSGKAPSPNRTPCPQILQNPAEKTSKTPHFFVNCGT